MLAISAKMIPGFSLHLFAEFVFIGEEKCDQMRPNLVDRKIKDFVKCLKFNNLQSLFVPRTRLELVQTLRSKGFSCHYSFRYHCCLWSGLFLHHRTKSLRCVVSSLCTFLLPEAWLKIAFSVPVKVSLNLRHSTSPLSGSALKLCLSPSCLPFHHQGSWDCKDNQLIRNYKIRQFYCAHRGN